VAKDILSGAAASNKGVSSRLSALQGAKDTSESQVLAVRTSRTVEVQLEAAKAKMDEITNSYPPFLRGSEQRQQYLMSISSIRNQIESMIIPPIQRDTAALVDQPAANSEKKLMWASLFQDIGVPVLTANGPDEASDAQIKAASSQLGTMKSELAGRRIELEKRVTPDAYISSPVAQYRSEVAGQSLSKTGLPLTNANQNGILKGL
jgi:hypothetical protein